MAPSLLRFVRAWLGLVLLGGLAYVSLRGLVAMIAIGSPVYGSGTCP